MASQQQSSNTPLSIRDRLRTVGYVYDYLDKRRVQEALDFLL